MEETIQFIYQEIKRYNVNINAQIDDIFKPALIASQKPIIKNHFFEAIKLLKNKGVFEQKNGTHFLTEKGFNVIYN